MASKPKIPAEIVDVFTLIKALENAYNQRPHINLAPEKTIGGVVGLDLYHPCERRGGEMQYALCYELPKKATRAPKNEGFHKTAEWLEEESHFRRIPIACRIERWSEYGYKYLRLEMRVRPSDIPIFKEEIRAEIKALSEETKEHHELLGVARVKLLADFKQSMLRNLLGNHPAHKYRKADQLARQIELATKLLNGQLCYAESQRYYISLLSENDCRRAGIEPDWYYKHLIEEERRQLLFSKEEDADCSNWLAQEFMKARDLVIKEVRKTIITASSMPEIKQG